MLIKFNSSINRDLIELHHSITVPDSFLVTRQNLKYCNKVRIKANWKIIICQIIHRINYNPLICLK